MFMVQVHLKLSSRQYIIQNLYLSLVPKGIYIFEDLNITSICTLAVNFLTII